MSDMFLSCLLINTGENPDRQDWRNRNWLRNLFRVHQRLCMAFPSAPQEASGAGLLKPYKPEDYPDQSDAEEIMQGNADVHEERTDSKGFLYRIDYGVPFRQDSKCEQENPQGMRLPSRPVILVQSAKKPDWNHAFGLNSEARDPATGRPVGNAGYMLAAPPQVKDLKTDYETGQCLRFRLNANPTRCLSNGPFKKHRVSVGRGRAAVLAWLWRKAEDKASGFELAFEKGKDGWDQRWRIETGMVYAWKGREDEENRPKMSFAYANIDGLLHVTNSALFRETLMRGIGPAKAFGFGLLTVLPVKSPTAP